jgi:hypothetical protein
MSVAHIELTADEAIKELKAIKVAEQNAISVLQSPGTFPRMGSTTREQAIANHRRRIDALHAAIEALGR